MERERVEEALRRVDLHIVGALDAQFLCGCTEREDRFLNLAARAIVN
jgi:hypothetical protein